MERHFSEEQVAEIVRRAADHQARQRRPDSTAPAGISESELKRVAQELGIDATALYHAISEVGATTLQDTGTIMSTNRTLERSVDADLPEEAYATILEEFVPAAQLGVQTVSIGKSLNYQSMAGMAQCNVNVSVRNGRTTLRVRSNAFLAALPLFIPATIISIISTVAIQEELVGSSAEKFFTNIFVLAAVWALAFIGFRSIVKFTNRKILDLTNRAAAKLAESADHLRGRLSQAKEPAVEVVESAEQTRI